MALSGSQITRLGVSGGPRPKYAAFIAKSAALVDSIILLAGSTNAIAFLSGSSQSTLALDGSARSGPITLLGSNR